MLLDDHGFITPRLALAHNRALVNPVTIIVGTTTADRHAGAHRTDAHADADFFGARRNGAVNSHHRDSGHRETLDHDELLFLLDFEEAMRPETNRSQLAPALS